MAVCVYRQCSLLPEYSVDAVHQTQMVEVDPDGGGQEPTLCVGSQYTVNVCAVI